VLCNFGASRVHDVEQFGSFMRSVTLPPNVDDTELAADDEDGVVNVRHGRSWDGPSAPLARATD
jgi:hypothetical protein